ncbi:DotA/TraY family protein [Pseudomonas aeruginosa]|nr:DotA/TraY family protein [Pseudomonas aeruginosa]MCS8543838.1 DotA/TraY family protein [Pseudomonas aeruginosa]MCT0604168.1 DotA/TraY family protein [Pseudomonas aeruginosa]
MSKLKLLSLMLLMLSQVALGDQLVEAPALNTSNILQQILDFLSFGTPNAEAHTSSLISTISYTINVIALTLAAYLLTYNGLYFVIQTANHGTPGGKVVSSFWMPIRTATATIMLLPLPLWGGYSSVQVGIYKIAGVGISMADKLTETTIDYLYDNGMYKPPALADSKVMVANWISAEACAQYINSYTNKTTIAPRYRKEYSDGIAKAVYSYDWIDENPTSVFKTSPRNGYCGSISITIPRELTLGIPGKYSFGLSEDKKAHYYIAPEMIESSFSGLLNEFQPQVAAAAAKVISDQQSLKSLQANGAAAQAQYEAAARQVGERVSSASQDLLSISSSINQRVSSIIANSVNTVSANNSGASWKNEIKNAGWSMLGTVFWQAAMSQERINHLAKTMTLTADAPHPDGDFERDDRFINISIRLTGLLKFAKESSSDRSSITDRSVIVSIEGSGVDGSGDQIKSWISSAAMAISKSLVLGGADTDMLTSMQYSGTVMTSAGEILWGATAVANATAETLSAVANKTADDASRAATSVPLVGSLFGAITSGIGSVAVGAVTFATSMVKQVTSFLQPLIIALIVAGFTLSVVLPAIPVFFWFIGVINWIIFYIEALLVSPFWVAAHATAEKEGWGTEHTRQGYMLLAAILVGPTLMVAGFSACLLALSILGVFVNSLSSYVIGVIVTGWTSPFQLVGASVLLAIFAYSIIVRVMSMPNELYERGLRWINGGQSVTGAEQSVKETTLLVGAFGRKGESAAGAFTKTSPMPQSPPIGGPKVPRGHIN